MNILSIDIYFCHYHKIWLKFWCHWNTMHEIVPCPLILFAKKQTFFQCLMKRYDIPFPRQSRNRQSYHKICTGKTIKPWTGASTSDEAMKLYWQYFTNAHLFTIISHQLVMKVNVWILRPGQCADMYISTLRQDGPWGASVCTINILRFFTPCATRGEARSYLLAWGGLGLYTTSDLAHCCSNSTYATN